MNKNVTPIFEANMDAGLRAHYRRRGAEAVDPGLMPFQQLTVMPFDEALRTEAYEDEGGAVTDYEMRHMVLGVRAMFRLIKARGVSMPQIMKQLFAIGRSVHDDFFSSLTMTEAAMMFSETKAAHSWRCKVLSGEIKLAGMKGYQIPGQKRPESSAVYAATAKRTCNRAKKAKQGSFLRKLKTKANVQPRKTLGAGAQRPTQRQATFTRKLSKPDTGSRKPESADLKNQRPDEASVQPMATPTAAGQRISGGSAPTSENGGGVAGASRVSGASHHGNGCRSGSGIMGRVA